MLRVVPAPTDGWWTALADICEAGTLDATDAHLMLTNSAVFDLLPPGHGGQGRRV
jgi:hypothetical protein